MSIGRVFLISFYAGAGLTMGVICGVGLGKALHLAYAYTASLFIEVSASPPEGTVEWQI